MSERWRVGEGLVEETQVRSSDKRLLCLQVDLFPFESLFEVLWTGGQASAKDETAIGDKIVSWWTRQGERDQSNIIVQVFESIQVETVPIVAAIVRLCCERFAIKQLYAPIACIRGIGSDARIDLFTATRVKNEQLDLLSLKECRIAPRRLEIHESWYSEHKSKAEKLVLRERVLTLLDQFCKNGVDRVHFSDVILQDKDDWTDLILETRVVALEVDGYELPEIPPHWQLRVLHINRMEYGDFTWVKWPPQLRDLYVDVCSEEKDYPEEPPSKLLFPSTLLSLALFFHGVHDPPCALIQHVAQTVPVARLKLNAGLTLAFDDAVLSGLSKRSETLRPLMWLDLGGGCADGKKKESLPLVSVKAPQLLVYDSYYYRDPKVSSRAKKRLAWLLSSFSLSAYRANRHSQFKGDGCMPFLAPILALLGADELGVSAKDWQPFIQRGTRLAFSRFGRAVADLKRPRPS